jgi:putative hemolysin
MLTEFLVILFLLILNGLLSMAEIALVSARKTRLDLDAQRGDRSAKITLEHANSPSRILSTIQIGITLIGILTGVYSGASLAEGMAVMLTDAGFSTAAGHTLAIVLVVTLVTFLSLVIGELVPKQIGLANPEGIAKFTVPVLLTISFITYPFTWLLSKTSDLIIRLLNIKASSDSRVTEEEIKAMVQEGAEDGEVQEIEQDIVERVFHLGDRKISSLMTHHSDLHWIDINDPPDVITAKFREDLHSVYPVCEDDLDNVKGVVFIKDLFLENICEPAFNIREKIRPAQFIHEGITAYETLELFKQEKIHYGLVVDEYGSTVGMVTLNDILEALVGDFNEPDPDEAVIIRRDDGSWLADGHMSFYEFAYEFGIQGFDKNKIKFDTLAGLAMTMLKHIPKPGERFTWRDFDFEVVDLDGNRIDKLIIKRKEDL